MLMYRQRSDIHWQKYQASLHEVIMSPMKERVEARRQPAIIKVINCFTL